MNLSSFLIYDQKSFLSTVECGVVSLCCLSFSLLHPFHSSQVGSLTEVILALLLAFVARHEISCISGSLNRFISQLHDLIDGKVIFSVNSRTTILAKTFDLLKIGGCNYHLSLRHFNNATVEVFEEEPALFQHVPLNLEDLDEIDVTTVAKLIFQSSKFTHNDVVLFASSLDNPLEVLKRYLIILRYEKCFIVAGKSTVKI